MVAPIPDTRAILEAIEEPALLVEGSRIAFANAASSRLFAGNLEGRDIRLAIRQPAALEQILSRRPGDVEVTGIGDAERPWLISVRPAGGNTLLVRVIDRSAMRAAEKMRVDFVANASHELRTPLATILGYAETIAEDGDLEPEMYTRFGGVIQTEARRMLRIVEDLMSLSRIEADRFVTPRELVSPQSLAKLAADRGQPLAASRECSIRLAVDEGIGPIPGDQSQLLQLLDNLLANAIRYGCGASDCSVLLAVRGEPASVSFIVSDDGDGIAPEHIPRLTERFYRVDDARSRDSGGTGLGLAIVKHIVERHRGSIDVRSILGQGTTVTVRLPRR